MEGLIECDLGVRLVPRRRRGTSRVDGARPRPDCTPAPIPARKSSRSIVPARRRRDRRRSGRIGDVGEPALAPEEQPEEVGELAGVAARAEFVADVAGLAARPEASEPGEGLPPAPARHRPG